MVTKRVIIVNYISDKIELLRPIIPRLSLSGYFKVSETSQFFFLCDAI